MWIFACIDNFTNSWYNASTSFTETVNYPQNITWTVFSKRGKREFHAGQNKRNWDRERERERELHAVSEARIKGSSYPCLTLASLKHTQPILSFSLVNEIKRTWKLKWMEVIKKWMNKQHINHNLNNTKAPNPMSGWG